MQNFTVLCKYNIRILYLISNRRIVIMKNYPTSLTGDNFLVIHYPFNSDKAVFPLFRTEFFHRHP